MSKQTYDVEIETRVRGIPCVVGVIYYFRAQPNPYAHSDVDYYGYTDRDYIILDRKGRPAPWLENKMTKDDYAKVDKIVDEYYEQQAKDEIEFPEGL